MSNILALHWAQRQGNAPGNVEQVFGRRERRLWRDLTGARLAGGSVCSASPRAARWYPDLRTWLTARLPFDYPALRSADLGRDAAAALEGHILPILDGLDELPTAAQAAMINALNRSLGTDPLVLTCRTAEFVTAVENARQLLMAALVMEPEPMSGDAIAEYLERCRPPRAHPAWDDVLRSVRTQESPLTEAAADALGLWLVTETYLQPRTGPDGTPIPFPDPAGLVERSRFPRKEDLIGHLVDQYIPTIIASRPPSPGGNEPMRPRKRHDPAKVEQWLGFIAHLMSRPIESGSDSRDFAWWRLAKDTETLTSPRILLLPAAIMGLLLGVPLPAAMQLWSGPPGEFLAALGIVLLAAASYLTVAWRYVRLWLPRRLPPPGPAACRRAALPVPARRPAGPPGRQIPRRLGLVLRIFLMIVCR